MSSRNKDARVLHVRVGESLTEAGVRAAATKKAIDEGRTVKPFFGARFSEIGQMLAVFTPKRWELIAALREAEPATVAVLSQRLQRHYKNVHADVNVLIEWMALERGVDGRVFVPWTEIVVDMKLPEQMAT